MALRRVARFLCWLMVVVAASPGVAEELDSKTATLGRQFTDIFQKGSAEEVWQHMSERMQSALGDLYHLKGFQASINSAYGPEVSVHEELTEEKDGLRTYRRRAGHENGSDLIWQWSFGQDDGIEGFYVRRVPVEADSAYLDYQTQAALRLPFAGYWKVFWGGRTVEENYHAADAGQRFAYDFVIQRAGKTHTGDGTALTDYYCWDEPILAPAEGTVVARVDGLPDQPLGEMDADRPAGNHVVLDLGNEEFIFLAHLRNGSVAVSGGQHVDEGQEIGRCGNSGNSSEPHLHVHMQTTPELGAGKGLPAQFQNYRANGALKLRGEPVRGQTVIAVEDILK